MICSAANFCPRGISCPPSVCPTRDSLSEMGDVEGGQVARGWLGDRSRGLTRVRLTCLADRPAAVAVLAKIVPDEIERLLCAAAGVTGAPGLAECVPKRHT